MHLKKIMLILGLAALEFVDGKTSLSKDQTEKLQKVFKERLKKNLEFENLEFDSEGYAELSQETLEQVENEIPDDFDLNPKKQAAKKTPAPKADTDPADTQADDDEPPAPPVDPKEIDALKAKIAKQETDLAAIRDQMANEAVTDVIVAATKKNSTFLRTEMSKRSRIVANNYLFGEEKSYLAIDSKRPWNKAAQAMLMGEDVKPMFTSTSIDFDQLNNDFGSFIRGRKDDIINWFMPYDKFNEIFPRVTGVDEGDIFMSLDISPVTQAYQSTWTPKGKVKFTGRKPVLFDIKIDLEFESLKAIERTWLNEFNTEGSNAYKMSFVEFCLFSIAVKAVQEDQMAMINGVYVAPTEGVAGNHLNKMDGLREILWQLQEARLAKPFPLGEWVAGSTLEFVNQMIALIPEEYRSKPNLALYGSIEFVRTYWEDRRLNEGTVLDYDPKSSTVVGYDNIRLIGVPYAGNSKRVVITPVGNVKQLFGYKDNEYPKFEIEKTKRAINVFTDYKKAMHVIVAGHKSANAGEFAERDFSLQLIWFNNADLSSDVPMYAKPDQDELDVTRHKFIRTVANDDDTAITDIEGAANGDLITIMCGSLTNASTIANSGNFALTAAWEPTEVGEYIILLARSDGKFVEIERVTPSDEPTAIAFTANDATPSVEDGNYFKTADDNSGALAITNLDDAEAGETYKIYGNDGTHASTISNGGNFALASASWIGATGNYIILYFNGTKFYEVERQSA